MSHEKTDFSRFAGVYAAALTPLHSDFSIDLEGIHTLLSFLSQRGCHGALLCGTTGEGPSFAPDERIELWKAAQKARQALPGFKLLAGTGTPSLAETSALTKSAFDAGLDGVVVLPPYYFRKVTDDGLFAWFSAVIQASVPEGSPLFGYHIPGVSGVALSIELLARLKEAFPGRFAGIKDSSGSSELAVQLGQRFGKDLIILNGNDRLFSFALENQASGCITALANLVSPDLRRVWNAFQASGHDVEAQSRLNAARDVTDRYQPVAPLLKGLLAHRFHLPRWSVRPPLLPAPDDIIDCAAAEMAESNVS